MDARRRVWGRLGYVDELPPPQPPVRRVLFHGVSLGEVKLIKTLLDELAAFRSATGSPTGRALEPVISSTTPAGHAESERWFPKDHKTTFPIDYPGCPGRFLDRVKPDAVVLMEWEVWPGFLRELARRSIPCAIVNGRISERTFKRYRAIAEFAARRLGAVTLFAMQNKEYADRVRAFRVPDTKIAICGNMKFDGLQEPGIDGKQERVLALARWRRPGAPLLVAGSTHNPEEALVLRVVERLRREGHATLQLALVPRHLDRVSEVEALAGLTLGSPVRWSQLQRSQDSVDPDRVLLVDTMGDLEGFYRAATVAFVGGSLHNDRGGQNMLEPAALGIPVIHGPSVPNFEEAAAILDAVEASCVVESEGALFRALGRWLADPTAAAEAGRRGAACVQPNRGATRETVVSLASHGIL